MFILACVQEIKKIKPQDWQIFEHFLLHWGFYFFYVFNGVTLNQNQDGITLNPNQELLNINIVGFATLSFISIINHL